MNRSQPFSLRLFRLSFRVLRGSFVAAQALLKGFWLGVLSREALHRLDENYYDDTAKYQDDAYNGRGLLWWEEEAISKYFAAHHKLLVTGAGGGREVLALRRAGFEAWGQEVHPDSPLMATIC